MPKFINKSKYEVLAVRTDSIEDSIKIQQLCFDNGITWDGHQELYKHTCYIYIIFSEGIMRRSSEIDLRFLSKYKWDKEVYTIEDYYKIEKLIKFGEKPFYLSKRKLLENFINKSKYEVLAVRTDSIEDGRRIQDLCFDNGILWAGDRGANYFDNTGYIYINLLNGQMLRSNQLDLLYLSEYKWDTKEYGIDDIYKIERIIKNGEKPNYSPKRKLLESFDIKNYPYREIGFRIFTQEQIISVINFFYDNYKIENRNKKEEIIKEIIDIFKMALKYRIITIDFHLDNFDIIDTSYMEHKKLFGFDPVLYTMDDLIKFQVVPNYKPRKRILEGVDVNIDVKETNYFKKYNTFVVIFDTYIDAKEFEKIRLLLNDTFDVRLRDYILDNIYSSCIENQFYIAFRLEENNAMDWGWGKISSLEKHHKKENYQRVFTVDDINTESKINNILNLREILPAKNMYKPKTRILESVKETQYRFKTEEEFIKEFGPHWRYRAMPNVSFSDDMDHLLGTDLEVDFPDDEDEILVSREDNSFRYNSIDDISSNDKVWFIVRQFLTKKKPTVPNYKPKKFKDF